MTAAVEAEATMAVASRTDQEDDELRLPLLAGAMLAYAVCFGWLWVRDWSDGRRRGEVARMWCPLRACVSRVLLLPIFQERLTQANHTPTRISQAQEPSILTSGPVHPTRLCALL